MNKKIKCMKNEIKDVLLDTYAHSKFYDIRNRDTVCLMVYEDKVYRCTHSKLPQQEISQITLLQVKCDNAEILDFYNTEVLPTKYGLFDCNSGQPISRINFNKGRSALARFKYNIKTFTKKEEQRLFLNEGDK